MEATIILLKSHHNILPHLVINSTRTGSKQKQKDKMNNSSIETFSNSDGFWNNESLLATNSSTNISIGNLTNTFDFEIYQLPNETYFDVEETSWVQCKEWTPTQHTLFQTAHFFFAAAFLVPGSFKQSVLLVRGLLTIGYFFLMIWGSVDICAPDIALWNLLIVLLNFVHTAILTWKFLPPTLTLDLLELYMKVFKPLRVSKKHFKEIVREGKVMSLDKGDIYAVEDVSPADERLAILLRGRLRVTCDDTHLHFVSVHQFVDSPEWEANHEQSDNVFQVTITAEEDSIYFCWPRMKLERVLRHKPRLKVIFDCIIGKDITQKLYALNEHLSGLSEERNRERHNKIWAKSHNRSLSMDAVNTGTTGLVRSDVYKNQQRKNVTNSVDANYMKIKSNQTWIPLTAKHFPVNSPFTAPVNVDLPQPPVHAAINRSNKKDNNEVKFCKN